MRDPVIGSLRGGAVDPHSLRPRSGEKTRNDDMPFPPLKINPPRRTDPDWSLSLRRLTPRLSPGLTEPKSWPGEGRIP